jgi:hypothetical protein
MVHFPALPSAPYVFRGGYSGITQSGFPHSDTPGSKPACGSPRLFAACHVLHRLLAPRHSPYALSSLTKFPFPLALRVCGQRTTDCRVFSCQRVRRTRTPNVRGRLVRFCPSTRAHPRARSGHSTRLAARHERGGESAESNGGEYRDRTGDLLVANQALSQLS